MIKLLSLKCVKRNMEIFMIAKLCALVVNERVSDLQINSILIVLLKEGNRLSQNRSKDKRLRNEISSLQVFISMHVKKWLNKKSVKNFPGSCFNFRSTIEVVITLPVLST